MKKIFAWGILWIILFTATITVNVAIAAENDVYYSSAWTGVVTCTKAGLRSVPDTRDEYQSYYLEIGGKKYTNVRNSDELQVVGQTGDGSWYIVRVLVECEAENCNEIVPMDLYIRSCFVKLNPCYLKLGRLTVVYAAPWEGVPAVGEKSKGTVMTVLAESQNWYCVQLADKTAGAGFIPKWDFAGEILTEKPAE